MQDLINKIHNADCLEKMKEISDKSIDMILCDLPYGTTACKWDTIIPFEPLWEQYKRIIKDNGAIVLTASQPFTTNLVSSNIKQFRYEWIWNKTQGSNIFNAKKQPMKTHENILVFSKFESQYYPIMTKAEKKNIRPIRDGKSNIYGNNTSHSVDYDNQLRYPKSILKYSCNDSEVNKLNRIHPTQKPVALFEYLIKTYTNEGDLVLDNCSGSGTTAIACLGTNRKYICIEKDEVYYKKSLERVEEYNKQLKLF